MLVILPLDIAWGGLHVVDNVNYFELLLSSFTLCACSSRVYSFEIFLVKFRYRMMQSMLIGTKHSLTLLEPIIILNGQWDQGKENLTFWNLKMLG